ncbi:MAG: NADH-quinone oxidoreductase subunit C [Deltaproteobacteria bacterium]|nr:NADH-quinone oxidoreductase subunit C [Deltaproteobacteria bacterium]
MDGNGIVAAVRARFPDAVVADGAAAKDPWIQVAPVAVADVMRHLRDAPDLAFDHLVCVTGVDLTGIAEKPDLRCVWHVASYAHGHQITVRADVPRDAAVLGSVTGIWPSAAWHERETWDLLGIRFEGHPDLRRILLPEEWVGHPLRKDWKEAPRALGFPTTRRTLLDEIRGGNG